MTESNIYNSKSMSEFSLLHEISESDSLFLFSNIITSIIRQCKVLTKHNVLLWNDTLIIIGVNNYLKFINFLLCFPSKKPLTIQICVELALL